MIDFTCKDCRHWESDGASDGVCNAHNMLFGNGTPFCQYFETKDGKRPRFCRLALSVDEMAEALATVTLANVEVALAAVKKPTEFSDDEKKKMLDEMKSWLMEVE